jgi:energy-coupling factor transporter transmembrane protein EcfT
MTLLAFKTRGIGFEGGMIKRAQVAVQLVGTIFVNAFKRAESTSMALSVKGYATRHVKAVFPPVRFSVSSMFVFLISVIILGVGWRY